MSIALVTSANFPTLGPDGPLILAALARQGIEAQIAVWSDPEQDWSNYKLCVIVSTWDYYLRYAEFIEWVEKVRLRTRLWNSASIIVWNSHKTYLKELEEQAIPIVSTVWLKQDLKPNLKQLFEEQGWSQIVLKPTVSAAAYDTIVIGSASLDAGQAHLDRIISKGDVMMQPYLASLETYGEHSLIFIDGKLSHTVSRISGLKEGEARTKGDDTIVEPSPRELELANQILELVKEHLLYARVDFALDHNGQTALMELELIEPFLFLACHTPAADSLAQAIARLYHI